MKVIFYKYPKFTNENYLKNGDNYAGTGKEGSKCQKYFGIKLFLDNHNKINLFFIIILKRKVYFCSV